ncbi:MAG: HAD family phosphatase [Clostridiales bacterium]|jgi:phosphoserine phosphatase|nr:HAD family phosphatase [Clostridiales bacterium]
MIKLACFDLDDTLTRDIHSVMLLCILNGTLENMLEIEKLENDGKLNWIDADYQKAALVKGLSLEKLHKGFSEIIKPLKNICQTIHALNANGIKSIIITAGPVQVANEAKTLWGFDASYGSEYEVCNGVFTGKILTHIGDKGKTACLQNFCELNNILFDECIAIGDGSTDIPLFKYCGKSIAINACDSVINKAIYSITTDDMSDVLRFILPE